MYITYVILLTLLYYTYKKRKFFLLSPVDIFILYFISVIAITLMYDVYYPKKDKFNYFDLDFISSKDFRQTMFVFINMVVLFLIGVNCYTFFHKEYNKINRLSIKVIEVKNIKTELLTSIVIVLLMISLLLVYIDNGNGLFYRSQYIPKKSSILKTIYQNLFIFLSVLSGLLYKKNRMVAIFSIMITILIGISLGSRTATIYLILFGASLSFFIESKQNKILFYFISLPLVTLFFGYNLSLRSESFGHGLFPYLKIVVNKPFIIFKYTISNIYYTFVFGFYDTTKTMELYKNESISNLITCLNPMPGGFTRWPQLAPKLRTNEWLPYTAIGELARFPIFSFFYYLLLGFYFAYVDNFIKKQILCKKYVFSILQVLLLLLFVIHSFEYNLRSTNRFIVYSILVLIIFYFMEKIKRYKIVIK